MSDVVALSDVIKAANFAAIKHRFQKRKDSARTPYINHPIGVANILAEEGGVTDSNVLQAALLHDTVEDTETTLDEVETHFGKDVRDIVAEVTDDKSLSWVERKQQQIERAPRSSTQAKLVKLADKLYNLRDLERETPRSWTELRKEQYFVWASKVCRGLRGTNDALEAKLEEIFKRHNTTMQ